MARQSVRTARRHAGRRERRQTANSNFPYLANAPTAVRSKLADTVNLPTFRDSIRTKLTKSDRIRLIEQALLVLEQNYVHLPLKQAIHAVNPVQRLRLLHYQIQQEEEDGLTVDANFHRELSETFLSLRDLHTSYFLPEPYGRMTAFVPFMLESFFEGGQRRYLVSHIFNGFQQPPFAVGAEVLRWNSIPIERAVELNGNRYAGSNFEARRARGVETLTIRPLVRSLPPDEEKVILEYQSAGGETHELRVDWSVVALDSAGLPGLEKLPEELAALQGVDIELALVRRLKKTLFAPHVLEDEAKMSRRRGVASRDQGLNSTMPSVFEARPVETPSGTFGYLRIRTFSVGNADAFVDEFLRLIEQLPRRGLVIDVRGNGGGLIPAGEQLLQILTPKRIEPTLFQFVNTSLNSQLCRRNEFLHNWMSSLDESVKTAAIFSQGYTITSPDAANAIGQRYYGPVLLITDGLCYSTTDIFAAGFQDHNIGMIMGIDRNTGAGGANVWPHTLLQALFPESDSPYKPLPADCGLNVAIRRTIRVGTHAGTVLEDFGVVPDEFHHTTRDDLLNDNVDLINHAAELLSSIDALWLDLERIEEADDSVIVKATTLGMSRLDIFADDRPVGSVDVTDGDTELTIPASATADLLFQGYDAGQLVAARRLAREE